MLSRFLLLVFLFFSSFNLYAQESKAYRGISQLYPTDRAIRIETRKGYLYTHIEGRQPQWKFGTLLDVVKHHPPVSGTGDWMMFLPSIEGAFHIVEEQSAMGYLQLHFKGRYRKSFRYYIRQDSITIAEGEVGEEQLEKIPPIALPYGSYTFQAVAKGYSTPQPVLFNLSEYGFPVNLDVSLDLQDVLLSIATDPPYVTNGKPVILRRISSKEKRVLWSREVLPNGDLIAVKEGQYTIEFPHVDGYEGPGNANILGRFNFSRHHSPNHIVGTYQLPKSHLKVRYHTGEKRERIDQVRFWLIDANGNKKLYPDKGQYYDDPKTKSREVTIEDLATGEYVVEFLLPNSDGFFANLPQHRLILERGKTSIVDQKIPPRYGTIEAQVEIQEIAKDPKLRQPFIVLLDKETSKIIASSETGYLKANTLSPGVYQVFFGDLEGYLTPSKTEVVLKAQEHVGPIVGRYSTEVVPLQILSKKLNKNWSLYQGKNLILRGQGNKDRILLPPGIYYIEAEEEKDFHPRFSPDQQFTLVYGKPHTVEIDYIQDKGLLQLDAALQLLNEDQLVLRILTQDGALFQERTLESVNGRVMWEQTKFPVGRYFMDFILPPYYHSTPREHVVVSKEEPAFVHPNFRLLRAIHVQSGSEDAIYHLRSLDGFFMEGRGEQFSFEGLLPGKYTLDYQSLDSKYILLPDSEEIELGKEHDRVVQAKYQGAGFVTVSANVPDFSFSCQDSKGNIQRHEVNNKKKTLFLAAGKYHFNFEPLRGDFAKRYGEQEPLPIELELRPKATEYVHVSYEPSRGSLVLKSNLDEASYTVYDISDGDSLSIGHFRGRHTVIPMTFTGTYRVVFHDVPHYQSPDAITVTIGRNERRVLGAEYQSLPDLVNIPAGASISGDVFGDGAEDESPSRVIDIDEFFISAYEVSNQQYADWLSKASREGKIHYETSKGKKGQVYDKDGHLLFETVLADADSQIQAKGSINDSYIFQPIAGKENHPVIEVTWYGANAYCEDLGYSLPSEAEWEKAASMAKTRLGRPLKKFHYGFGSDEIDKTLANYRDKASKEIHKKPRTTEVGFYNGVNFVLFNEEVEKILREVPAAIESSYGTKIAKSPHGLYDMSGNVREWVFDYYKSNYYEEMETSNPMGPAFGKLKVTKGGSFDSFPYELRSSARMALPPETSDAFTGFRVVMRPKNKRPSSKQAKINEDP